jgi:hypothetical protein
MLSEHFNLTNCSSTYSLQLQRTEFVSQLSKLENFRIDQLGCTAPRLVERENVEVIRDSTLHC